MLSLPHIYTPTKIEFELDTDDLDDAALEQLQDNSLPSRRSRNGTGSSRRNASGEQSMPLLVGLIDQNTARRRSLLRSSFLHRCRRDEDLGCCIRQRWFARVDGRSGGS